MKHNFLNWERGVLLMQDSSDRAVIGALHLIHQGIQHCSGLPIVVTRSVRLPIYALDIEWFYGAVADIISNWNSKGCLANTYVEGTCNSTIETLLRELDTENQLAFLKFCKMFEEVPRTTQVDDFFCEWLFAETILLCGLLPKVLDGSIATKLEEHANADFETWAATWT